MEPRNERNMETVTASPQHPASEANAGHLDMRATVLLAIQAASSSFSYRAAEFAYPLYFVELYTNTLLPASVYGLVTTACAMIFSGSVGTVIDRFMTHRLLVARAMILSQKIFVVASYGLFLLLFLDAELKRHALNGGHGSDGSNSNDDVWTIFSAITILGCALVLSNVGVSVCIERDWVTSIAAGNSRRLTQLNAIMRRIDLLSKLLAPLFVSLLTSTVGYAVSAIALLGISAGTTIFELVFIGVVFRRCTVLHQEQSRARESRSSTAQTVDPIAMPTYPPTQDNRTAVRGVELNWLSMFRERTWVHLKILYGDWKAFAHMPIFLSSITIALLYMSVLSFDPTFIAYLKSETTYTDAFIAGMRGVCVVAGLVGTFVSPLLMGRIGLIRTGSWSLWIELLPLTLSIIALYVGRGTAWNTALLFGGLALSRVGLWSFDLAQLAQVQAALAAHPRRNALMALQFALQNALDLGHYALTLGWHRPAQFRNAANVSYVAIGAATLLYVFGFARRERGHVFHLNKFKKLGLVGLWKKGR